MRARTLGIAALISLLGCGSSPARSPDDLEQEAIYEGPAPTDTTAEREPRQAEPQDRKPPPMWPRRFARGETAFATYEPQVDSWENDKVTARVAVEVFPPNATVPTYGIAWLDARTVTDRSHGLVTFDDVRVTRVHFPTAKEREPEYLEALRGADLVEAKTIKVERLKDEVAFAASHQPVPPKNVKNEPPAILVSNKPVVLVLIDGRPQLRDEGGAQRVINTRALVMSEKGKTATYVWAGDRWFHSSTIDGRYVVAADGAPPAIEAAKKRLEVAPKIDLFADATERIRGGASVVVATKPTELIETRGAPAFEAIPGTAISYVANTDSDVLRDDSTKQTYVLLSGRWFRAPSLDGPWKFVTARDVPASFRTIPKEHREARVLTGIAGTEQAEEAAIAASVPQTATVDRGETHLTVPYDGAPDFQPVQGANADLRYAVNSPTPVLEASDGLYYAVENGVWFVSASPTGPWTVATNVPDAVYSIPPSSPIHYVTYVRIYGYSPDYAYVGYTPGYMGAVYTDGVVVWGTGYQYSPWVGSDWYGYPSTWGFGVGVGFGLGFGFGLGVPFVAGRHHPWWGPTRYWYPGHGGANVYQHWSPSVVRAPPVHARVAPPVVAPPAPRAGAPYAPRGYVPAAPRVGAPRVGAPAAPPIYTAPGASPRVYGPPVGAPHITSAPFNPPVNAQPRVSVPPMNMPTPPRISAPPPVAAPHVYSPPMNMAPPPRISAPPPVAAPRMNAPPPMAAPRMNMPPPPHVSAPPAHRGR